ncbi:MAG: hypothetical protein WD873_03580 [Candidatus Hydrogenedentales bacterium]
MVETFLDSPARWLMTKTDESDVVLGCQCRLSRNLTEFHFPDHCTTDERHAVVEQVHSALENTSLLTSGSFYALEDLDARDVRFLVERRLLAPDFLDREGPRAVYVADDQSMSIAVNGEDHIVMRALGPGLHVQETWQRLNMIDDDLAGMLDYAYNERLGYLTSAVSNVGTGLKVRAFLALPSLTMRGLLPKIDDEVRGKRHTIEAVYGSKDKASGDLYQIGNITTLGRSEEEILFHLKHLAGVVMERERRERERLLSETPAQVQDRVGRALGVAAGARILGFGEGLALLTSLRMGRAVGQLDNVTYPVLNEVFMASHNAHLELRCGANANDMAIRRERATLFRQRFQ